MADNGIDGDDDDDDEKDNNAKHCKSQIGTGKGGSGFPSAGDGGGIAGLAFGKIMRKKRFVRKQNTNRKYEPRFPCSVTGCDEKI